MTESEEGATRFQPIDRRRYLRMGALAASGALAGCTDLATDGGDGPGDGEGAGEATVTLEDDPSEWVVPETLFGRFAEHYGDHEIDPGISAEHVTNVAFVEWCQFQDDQVSHYDDFETVGEHEGVPFPWYPVGEADLERPESGGVRGYGEWILDESHWPVEEGGGDAYQRIAAEGGEGGIGQHLLLPDWRTLDYELSISARSEGIDELEVRLSAPEDDVLASVTIDGIGGEWSRFEDIELALEDESGSKRRIDDPDAHLEESAYGEYDLAIVAEGGAMDIDWVSLVPADVLEGELTGAQFNPTTVELMRDRNTTLLKWPGGNYTSTYPWENGIGPREERPIWPNVIWNGLDPNIIGTAEYVDFCEVTGAEATITVGVTVPPEAGGRGFQPPEPITPEDAANWVEYCNGSTETEYGSLRSEHGYEEPFDVSVWEVGNEVWGSWQAGGTDDPQAFADRAREFAEAMRAVDDSITIVPDGMDPKYDDPNLAPDPEEWNRTVFETLGDEIEGIGMHRYNWGIRDDGERGEWREDNDADAIDYSEVLVLFPTQFGELLSETAALAAESGLEDMEIVVGEWGLFPHVDPGDPWPGMETMAGAAYVAGMYNAFIRESEHVKRACHTHLPTRMFPSAVNPTIPVGYTKRLYATVFEDEREWRLAESSVDDERRSVPETGHRIRPMDDVSYVDAAAMVADDAYCAFVVNRNLREEMEVTLDVPDAFADGAASVTVQSSTGDPHEVLTSHGEYPESWFEWTGLDVYEIDEREVEIDDGLELSLAPAAVARVLIE